MPFSVIETATGTVVNDLGNGSRLSGTDLGNFTIEFDPNVPVAGSVAFVLNGQQVRVDGTGPFYLTAEGNNNIPAGANFEAGPVELQAVVYEGPGATGNILRTETVNFSVVNPTTTPAGSQVGTGENGEVTSGDLSEFDSSGEAEGEAESEAEAEVGNQTAAAGTSNVAIASAIGSNAVAQTMTSGTIALDNALSDSQTFAAPSLSEGPSGEGGRPIGGDAPIAEELINAADVSILSAEAEAEVEVEAEVAAEVAFGLAAATGGTSVAAAAVGNNTLLNDDGSPSVVAMETSTAIDAMSGSSTSVSGLAGGVTYDEVEGSETAPNNSDSAITRRIEEGPSAAELDDEVEDDALLQIDSEVEVEVESEAEAEAEVADGAAAAVVAGGTGVAVAGDFSAIDAETSVALSTSTSQLTETAPEFFGAAVQGVTNSEVTSTSLPTRGTLLNFINGAQSAGVDRGIEEDRTTGFDDDDNNDSNGNDAVTGTGLFEAEAEAESEVEVEAEVGNNSAAVAAIATGGGGASGVNASALSSSSTSAATSTAADNGLQTRQNDVVESTSFRGDNDQDSTEETAQARALSDDPAAVAFEAEAEAEAEVEVSVDGVPSTSATADGDAIGTATAGSATVVQGFMTGLDNVVNEGTHQVAERIIEADEAEAARVVTDNPTDVTLLPDGNLEVEVEAEAEVEVEAEVGYNSAAAGAGANAVQARNNILPVSAEGATATAASTSVWDNAENSYSDIDNPGPSALGDRGDLATLDVNIDDVIFEVEVEAEAEAEVGWNAGAAAAAAGAAGAENLQAVTAFEATINGAAAAAASGANTEIRITIPPAGEAGEIVAYARAWDPEGQGVAVAVAVAGLPFLTGLDNEAELEAEGQFEAVVEVRIDTTAMSEDDMAFLFDLASATSTEGDADEEPEGLEANFESEAEVEAEAEAEAGYGVAAAAAGVASAGLFAEVSAGAVTATEFVEVEFGDLVSGIAGIDNRLVGTDGIDLIVGDTGSDTLFGGGGADRILAGAGSDRLFGGDGNDALSGEAGNDTISAGRGDDLVIGGGGVDRAVLGNIDNKVVYRDLNDVVYVLTPNGSEVDVYVDVEVFETNSGTFGFEAIETFDGLGYIASNDDLIARYGDADISNEELINIAAQDFAIRGAEAGADIGGFDPEAYLEANPLLELSVGTDPTALTLDFITEGFEAGRDSGPAMDTDALYEEPANGAGRPAPEIGGSDGPLGEAGVVTVSQAGPDAWTTVNFETAITDATVVMGGMTLNGGEAATIRVRNVTDTGFEFQIDEWDFLDGAHTAESISWLALQEGRHLLDDGRTVVVGNVEATTSFSNVAVDAGFENQAAVMTQVTTTNGPAAVITRVSDVDADGFSIRLQEGEAADGVHATETVSYVMIESEGGDGFASGVLGGVDSTIDTFSLDGTNLGPDTAFLTNIQTYNGIDPATVRVTSFTGDEASIFVQEERSADMEVNHIDEDVGYLAIGTGVISGRANVDTAISEVPTVTGNYEAGVVSFEQTASDAWQTVTFAGEIADAVVVMGPVTDNGPEEGAMRIRNVTDTGFEFQLDEWDYLDGSHLPEDVSYMAISAGTHTLEDGRTISAGTTSGTGDVATASFETSFSEAPIVMTQAAGDTNASAITSRITTVTTEGFTHLLQEEEANDGVASEDVMWIAVEGGNNADGSVQSGIIEGVTEGDETFVFDTGLDDDFVFLADMQTFFGTDTATVRLNDVDTNGGSVVIEEEQSLDDEIFHLAEDVGYLALDAGYFDLLA